MNRLWVVVLAAAVLTGCNRSTTSSTAKPSPVHAASAASLSVEDGNWEDAGPMRKVALGGNARTVYPFSLVAGGVYSPAELKRAMATSESLRAHYQNFDFKRVRLIRIQNNTPAFVSYRKNGKIFWTKRKITVHAGELVLADGHYLVRARCANQISLIPQDPVDVTPSDVEARLDEPIVPTILQPRLREMNSPLLPPDRLAPPSTVLARAYMPAATMPILRVSPVCVDCDSDTGSRPPVKPTKPPRQAVPMPDGDGLSLFALGFFLMAALIVLRKQTHA